MPMAVIVTTVNHASHTCFPMAPPTERSSSLVLVHMVLCQKGVQRHSSDIINHLLDPNTGREFGSLRRSSALRRCLGDILFWDFSVASDAHCMHSTVPVYI